MRSSHFNVARRMIVLVVAGSCTLSATGARAWGADGHQIVGSIAERLLAKTSPAVDGQVRKILGGHTLAEAATWADCVRDVRKNGDQFVYRAGPETPGICRQKFGTAAEQQRMIDYAAANWTDCIYENGGECHAAYHFADVAVQRSGYSGKNAGTNDHDIVHAINAAVLRLRGQPSPGPIRIQSKRDALYLLAHFVGDVHQPLHVGAVYLDARGGLVDPDMDPPLNPITETRGGNLLQDGSANLHAEWDQVSATWMKAGSLSALAAAAQGLPATTGDVEDWAEAWASETVLESHGAFEGLIYQSKTGNRWPIEHTADYPGRRGLEQKKQLERAGARLAQLLAAISPQPD
jgi:hypothetical protein